MFRIEFTEEEYLYLSTCFFLVSVEFSREHSGVIEDKHIAVLKVVYYFFEDFVFYFTGFSVCDHQATFVTMFAWKLCYKFLR